MESKRVNTKEQTTFVHQITQLMNANPTMTFNEALKARGWSDEAIAHFNKTIVASGSKAPMITDLIDFKNQLDQKKNDTQITT